MGATDWWISQYASDVAVHVRSVQFVGRLHWLANGRRQWPVVFSILTDVRALSTLDLQFLRIVGAFASRHNNA